MKNMFLIITRFLTLFCSCFCIFATIFHLLSSLSHLNVLQYKVIPKITHINSSLTEKNWTPKSTDSRNNKKLPTYLPTNKNKKYPGVHSGFQSSDKICSVYHGSKKTMNDHNEEYDIFELVSHWINIFVRTAEWVNKNISMRVSDSTYI